MHSEFKSCFCLDRTGHCKLLYLRCLPVNGVIFLGLWMTISKVLQGFAKKRKRAWTFNLN